MDPRMLYKQAMTVSIWNISAKTYFNNKIIVIYFVFRVLVILSDTITRFYLKNQNVFISFETKNSMLDEQSQGITINNVGWKVSSSIYFILDS